MVSVWPLLLPHFRRALVHPVRVGLTLPSPSGSRIPKAWAGIDLKVQPQEPLVLKDVENTDWYLLQGDTDVRVEVRHWAGSLTPTSALRGPLSRATGQPEVPDWCGG